MPYKDKARRKLVQRRSTIKAQLAVADIGTIPAVVNPARREACSKNLELALTTYFSRSCIWPFSEDHKRVLTRLQDCINKGGRYIEVMFRGSAKSTLSEAVCVLILCFAWRMFLVLFGADEGMAETAIASIKSELVENELLLEDFPEVVYPIRALDGKPQRCRSQIHTPGNLAGYKGKRLPQEHTFIEWTAETIVLPGIKAPSGWGTVKGFDAKAPLAQSPSSWIRVSTRGITAGFRGLRFKRPDGRQQRPDFVLGDDLQTTESASTALQVDKRLATVKKGILRLGGHGGQIAAFLVGTIIERDDLIDRLSDHNRNPSWQADRIPMVKTLPKAHDTLWLTDYANLRRAYNPQTLGDQEKAWAKANAFYKEHRAAMEEGAVVTWEHCYDHDKEISALQHAYNILIDDGPEVFASECQNAPLGNEKLGEDIQIIEARSVAIRINGLPVGIIPLAANKIVAAIDVQKRALYWGVGAFGDNFSGSLISYGCYPDPGRAYFALSELARGLQEISGASSVEGGIKAGLEAIVGALVGREWRREDGAAMRISNCLIDSAWSTKTVTEFCRTNPHAAVTTAARGLGISAEKKPFEDYAKKPGEKVGDHYRIILAPDRITRIVEMDKYFWKSFIYERTKCAPGDPGALLLCGKPQDADHRLFADHLAADYGIKTEGRGRVVYKWDQKAERPDNHYFAMLVMLYVAASMSGCSLMEKIRAPVKPRHRFSEMFKAAS